MSVVLTEIMRAGWAEFSLSKNHTFVMGRPRRFCPLSWMQWSHRGCDRGASRLILSNFFAVQTSTVQTKTVSGTCCSIACHWITLPGGVNFFRTDGHNTALKDVPAETHIRRQMCTYYCSTTSCLSDRIISIISKSQNLKKSLESRSHIFHGMVDR